MDVVKITDSGIARAADDPALTQSGVMFGTVHYMSPELLSGHSATAASDIYTLRHCRLRLLLGSDPI
jgi:serine/threonine-protein kinase